MAIIQTIAETIGHKPRSGRYKLIVDIEDRQYWIMDSAGDINTAWSKSECTQLIGILNRRELKRQGVDILITEVEWRG